MLRVGFLGSSFVPSHFNDLEKVTVEFGSGYVWRTAVYEVDLDRENSEQVFDTVGRVLNTLSKLETELRPIFTLDTSLATDERYLILRHALRAFCEAEWKRLLTVLAVDEAVSGLKNSRSRNPNPEIGQIRRRLEVKLRYIERHIH